MELELYDIVNRQFDDMSYWPKAEEYRKAWEKDSANNPKMTDYLKEEYQTVLEEALETTIDMLWYWYYEMENLDDKELESMFNDFRRYNEIENILVNLVGGKPGKKTVEQYKELQHLINIE